MKIIVGPDYIKEEKEDELAFFRGLLNAFLILTPFWLVIAMAFIFYLHKGH